MVGKILYFVLREKKKILGIQIGILAGLEYPPCSLVFQVTLIFNISANLESIFTWNTTQVIISF